MVDVVDDEVPELVGEVDDSLAVSTVLERRTVFVGVFRSVPKMNDLPLRIEVAQVDSAHGTKADTDLGDEFEFDVAPGCIFELSVVRPNALDLVVGRHLIVDLIFRRGVKLRTRRSMVRMDMTEFNRLDGASD